jgi:hypothetical protein
MNTRPSESTLIENLPPTPSESTVAQVYQNKWLITPLESALTPHSKINSFGINT